MLTLAKCLRCRYCCEFDIEEIGDAYLDVCPHNTNQKAIYVGTRSSSAIEGIKGKEFNAMVAA